MREERRQAEEDQSEEMEISESDSSGCDEEVEMWRRVGHRTGRKKAKVERGARISDSGWGQGSHSVNQYLSQSVNQSVSGEQREEVQMEVESGGDSEAAGSSGRSGIDGGESRGDMVGGGSYAEEDDEIMLEYMGNEGVGDEEIDRFMGWTTVDLRGESFSGSRRGRTGEEKRGGRSQPGVCMLERLKPSGGGVVQQHQRCTSRAIGRNRSQWRGTQAGRKAARVAWATAAS